MDPRQKARLRELFNRLVDRPLEPHDPFYEPFVATMSDRDPIEALATRGSSASGWGIRRRRCAT